MPILASQIDVGEKHVSSFCAAYQTNDQILFYFDFFWPEGQLVFTIFHKLSWVFGVSRLGVKRKLLRRERETGTENEDQMPIERV